MPYHGEMGLKMTSQVLERSPMGDTIQIFRIVVASNICRCDHLTVSEHLWQCPNILEIQSFWEGYIIKQRASEDLIPSVGMPVSLGFQPIDHPICVYLPRKRQQMLLSATKMFPNRIFQEIILWMMTHHCHERLQRVRSYIVVTVYKSNIFASRLSDPCIPCRTQSPIHRKFHIANARVLLRILLADLIAIVRRGIIDEHYLPVLVGLPYDAVQTAPQGSYHSVDGYDNA